MHREQCRVFYLQSPFVILLTFAYEMPQPDTVEDLQPGSLSVSLRLDHVYNRPILAADSSGFMFLERQEIINFPLYMVNECSLI